MSKEKVKYMVICSTLNQITNYMAIKQYDPEIIYNITYDDQCRENHNLSINVNEWDKNLRIIITDKQIIEIQLSKEDSLNIKAIKKKLEEKIVKKINDEIIWHITGGQRTVSLAISELVKEKKGNDRIVYFEGNSEKIIEISGDGSHSKCFKYEYEDIDFNTAFKLLGIKTKVLDSTKILKSIKTKCDSSETNEEKFYNKLYEVILKNEIINFQYDRNTNKLSIRDALVESNRLKEKTERQNFLKEAFKSLIKDNNEDLNVYDIEKSDEINMAFPAGYIFEKIVAYKIYKMVKNDNYTNEMGCSVKTYFIEKKSYKEKNHNRY